MLGHVIVSMTLDIYSHVRNDMQKGAAVALDQLLGNSAVRMATNDKQPTRDPAGAHQ